ncbi:MAG: hypothetical protein WC004_03365 [Candidatus Absconditabacterales bacterium]
MDTNNLIDKILKANKLGDVIELKDWKKKYQSILMHIHPDKCKHIKAGEALSKLVELKDQYEIGTNYYDDIGEYTTNGHQAIFSGDQKKLLKSKCLFDTISKLQDPASKHFRKCLPKTMVMDDGKLKIEFEQRSIPLSGLQLPQEHVNWVLSRILEFTAWFHQIGYAHCGLNPESIFIVPETHGIIVTSFYHTVKLDGKLESGSGKYAHWYTPSAFASKIAIPTIDLECAKKTAIYLLGDPSGSGVKLRKTHHTAFLDFVIAQHHDAYQCFDEYRKLIDKHFEKKFHSLTL